MRDKYDFVYLTNTPSFYKLNLCNEIARTHSLLLVLYGYGSEAVNKELSEESHYNFDFHFINKGDSNARNKILTYWKLLQFMSKLQFTKIIYSGWIAPEYILYSFISSRQKNVVLSESSVWDVSFKGMKGIVKKLFINRMSVALPSGTPHEELFKNIGFKGDIHLTGGVGIFYKPNRKNVPKVKNEPLRYIYVGRLIHVKNVEYLVEVFNKNGKLLTIVGVGELEMSLKSLANDNITFMGFIDNDRLGEIYREHDVFILPSTLEPWGLVVDEALYWGLPVIASNRVGAGFDLVTGNNAGLIFDLSDATGLSDAIVKMEENYDYYKSQVDQIDFEERDRMQVKVYTDLIIK